MLITLLFKIYYSSNIHYFFTYNLVCTIEMTHCISHSLYMNHVGRIVWSCIQWFSSILISPSQIIKYICPPVQSVRTHITGLAFRPIQNLSSSKLFTHTPISIPTITVLFWYGLFFVIFSLRLRFLYWKNYSTNFCFVHRRVSICSLFLMLCKCNLWKNRFSKLCVLRIFPNLNTLKQTLEIYVEKSS